ncbi:hypothetical protein D9V32_12710 [Mycetocola tolaasinivorans]|uniref:Uncharacterized protein n=2 Tax=Mycetocola tolaasinivorans TaxID=76635 RepID=A0A3L7A371_9MICO|nr:hypothetical protein D9V32_12710 [Mycetocola tolaasinivorans]
MDCTPVPDPLLAYDAVERDKESIDEVRGLLMVPLAFIAKGPMRHLDAVDARGNPMPLLGAAESNAIMLDTVLDLLELSGVEQTAEVLRVIRLIIAIDGMGQSAQLPELCQTGRWEGEQIWPENIYLPNDLVDLLERLASSFLLIGLVPARQSGIRQILKFSYHWVTEEDTSLKSRMLSVLVATGWAGKEVSMNMHMPHATASYHLEFHTPSQLDVRNLRIPCPDASTPVHGQILSDASGVPVAHVHGTYEIQPGGQASVRLAVPWRGLRMITLFVTALTALIFSLALFLDGATPTLMKQGGSAAALFLAVPAVFISFLAAHSENVSTSRMLVPLRFMLVVCALLLFAMAGSLVGQLRHGPLVLLWSVSLVVSVLLTLLLVLGGSFTRIAPTEQ